MNAEFPTNRICVGETFEVHSVAATRSGGTVTNPELKRMSFVTVSRGRGEYTYSPILLSVWGVYTYLLLLPHYSTVKCYTVL